MLEITAATLSRQRFLCGMRPEHLEALASAGTEVLFPARHRLFHEGDYADRFWLIESGYVALDVHVPGDGLSVMGQVGIGGLLSWSWSVPPHEWVFGAVCITEVRALQFSATEVRRLYASDPELAGELTRRLFQVVAGRLRSLAPLRSPTPA